MLLAAGPGPRAGQREPHHRHGEGRRAPLRGAHRRGPALGAGPHGAAQDQRARSATSTPSATTSSPSASARPARARAGWRWPWPCRRCRPRTSTASSSPGPAVEAGERLGFLPGDLMAKVDPYLRPLYDALYDMVEPEGAQRLLERGTVEVAPLAFMRGRTLNNSFIILDEAQNTTPEQMKMFLTRIGFGSKVVVTGDITQIDVPEGPQRPGRASSACCPASTASTSCTCRLGTSCATGSCRTSSTPTRIRPPARRRRVRDGGRGAAGRSARRRRPGRPEESRQAPAAPERGHGRGRGQTNRASIRSTSTGGAGWPSRCSTPRGSEATPSCRCSFVDEATIADLNVRFMGGTGPTDVLAFPIDETTERRAVARAARARDRDAEPLDMPLLLGDVVISPAVAARSAPTHAGTYEDEVALLVVHGVLHVLGTTTPSPTRGLDAGARTGISNASTVGGDGPGPPALAMGRLLVDALAHERRRRRLVRPRAHRRRACPGRDRSPTGRGPGLPRTPPGRRAGAAAQRRERVLTTCCCCSHLPPRGGDDRRRADRRARAGRAWPSPSSWRP